MFLCHCHALDSAKQNNNNCLSQIISVPPINFLVTSLVSELNFLFTNMPCNDLFLRNVSALSHALCQLLPMLTWLSAPVMTMMKIIGGKFL